MKNLCSLASAAASFAAACAVPALAQPGAAQFVGGGLNSRSAFFLDADFNLVSTFTGPRSFGFGNGVGVTGSTILVGDFDRMGWERFDLAGNSLGFTNAGTSDLQGLTTANGNVVVSNMREIAEYSDDGAFIRTIASVGLNVVEGLAFDGDNTIYSLGNTIDAYDYTTGTLVDTLTNPFFEVEDFDGTAITHFEGDLIIGSVSGNWARIDIATDSVIDSGNAGIDLSGLAVIPAPSSGLMLGAAGLLVVRRRRG